MASISVFFYTFFAITGVALLLLIAFAAVSLTQFFRANRQVRLQRSQRFVPYYGHLALGH